MTVTGGDELGRLAQDFNQLASTLEKNQQMRRDLMADISMKLRTPLAVLRGELEAFRMVGAFTPESIPSLQAEVATLTKLVDDLHQLSMSDEGALAYQKALTGYHHPAGSGGGRISRTIRQPWPEIQFVAAGQAMIFGDRDRLMQLFNNLLENSLRYTDSGGSLQFARRSGRMLVIDFADSAPASAMSSWPACLNVFTGRKDRATAPAAAPASDWRFASISLKRPTAALLPTIRLLAGLALKLSYRWNMIYRETYD